MPNDKLNNTLWKLARRKRIGYKFKFPTDKVSLRAIGKEAYEKYIQEGRTVIKKEI